MKFFITFNNRTTFYNLHTKMFFKKNIYGYRLYSKVTSYNIVSNKCFAILYIIKYFFYFLYKTCTYTLITYFQLNIFSKVLNKKEIDTTGCNYHWNGFIEDGFHSVGSGSCGSLKSKTNRFASLGFFIFSF